jgi:hypothetical protein
VLLLAAVALVLVGLWAPVAPAADAPAPGQQVVNSWALTPTGTDPNQPGSRPTFTYTLAPGASVTDSLTVWNYSNVQLNFHIYATDAYNTRSGSLDLLTAEQKPKDVGSWVTIDQNHLTLPPSSKASLGIKIAVPANATPGDHTAGIVAASQTDASNAEGKHVILDRRVGSRLYMRVSGAVKPTLSLENVSSDYHEALNPLDGSLDVTYTVRNTGNVRLGARQKVSVSDLLGSVADKTPPVLDELLPGGAVTRTEHFSGIAATLRVSAEVEVTPFIPKATGVALPKTTKLATTSEATHAWAIPWLLILVLLVLGATISYSRRRRRRSAGGPHGRGGTGGNPGQGSGPSGATRAPSPDPRRSQPVGGAARASSAGAAGARTM